MERRRRHAPPAEPAHPVDAALPNLAAWIDDGGEILIGRHDRLPCVAMALIDGSVTAGIRRRASEPLGRLLARLDATLAEALASPDGYIDGIDDA